MAHHHHRHEVHVAGISGFLAAQSAIAPIISADEVTTEADEPPERGFAKKLPTPFERKRSLLTQALVTSPKLIPCSPEQSRPTATILRSDVLNPSTRSNASATSTAVLTSDGGLTGPIRQSTPSPALARGTYAVPMHEVLKSIQSAHEPTMPGSMQGVLPLILPPPTLSTPQESAVEAGLGRKRRITFACGRKSTPPSESARPMLAQIPVEEPTTQKRPCALRFVCPSRDSEHDASEGLKSRRFRPPGQNPATLKPRPSAVPLSRAHGDSASTIRAIDRTTPPSSPAPRVQATMPIVYVNLERMEATRFHEFASSVEVEDDWMHDVTVHTKKLTVSDALEKETAFRKLGEEAEEEALQDEADAEANQESDDDDDDDDGDGDGDGDSDGNESDDEGGFADSDDESETGSEYNFWAPTRSTAATSFNPNEGSIRPGRNRTTSMSSTDSAAELSPTTMPQRQSSKQFGRSRPRNVKRATVELPDSTDFVCGTLDEDRPLEEAYVSCLEQRKRSKHTAVPQDIDPSFPTSEPEDDDNDDDDDDDEVERQDSDVQVWIKGQLEGSDADHGRGRPPLQHRSPLHSPKRLPSPALPSRYGQQLRSPPPPPQNRVSARSPRRRRSPPAPLKLKPRTSCHGTRASSHERQHQGINFAPMLRRPDLTRHKSLPRTPNPFSHRLAAEQLSAASTLGPDEGTPRDTHNRGAIDIVKGLEGRRQRRKEKNHYKLCQQRANENKRKPAPGKGAERMRELGLDIAGKGRPTGGPNHLPAQYVLSV